MLCSVVMIRSMGFQSTMSRNELDVTFPFMGLALGYLLGLPDVSGVDCRDTGSVLDQRSTTFAALGVPRSGKGFHPLSG